LLNLLEAKRIYWKLRSTIRWVKFGDENTKLFQAIASQNFRRNHIAQLKLLDGLVVTEHDQKVRVLWHSIKDNLGCSEHGEMTFNLDTLIQPVIIADMDTPFSREEIDALVKEFTTDKALGPNDFNGMFIKRCWHIIKNDFYAFYEGNPDLTSLNGSSITLVPKVSSLETVNDYHPISHLRGSIS
jgi:hypothetical protein